MNSDYYCFKQGPGGCQNDPAHKMGIFTRRNVAFDDFLELIPL